MLCDYYFDIPQTQHFCMMILTHFLGMAQRIVYTTHLTHTHTSHTPTPHTHTHTHTHTERGDTLPLWRLHTRSQAHLQVHQDSVPCCTADCRVWHHYARENTYLCALVLIQYTLGYVHVSVLDHVRHKYCNLIG